MSNPPTVTQLREALERIERDGHGDAEVIVIYQGERLIVDEPRLVPTYGFGESLEVNL